MGGNNMLREQRIMNRMAEELNGELDEYIMTFNGCDFWRIKEGEVIVNKTFKRILNIMADFNLTTTEDILDDVYKLPDSPDVMLSMLPKLAYMYGEKGGDSLLNRSMVLCYLLHYIVTMEDNLTATDILKDSADSELMYKKDSIWESIKHAVGLSPYPYKVRGNSRAMGLIAIISGKPIRETMQYIAEYKEIM
jgi:hypothetical protein